MVRERGAKRLRRELLVGFDPVPLYVALLEEDFGHLAAFFYDGCGGRAVGIRCSFLRALRAADACSREPCVPTPRWHALLLLCLPPCVHLFHIAECCHFDIPPEDPSHPATASPMSRWHPAALLPTAFSPATAHTAKPADSNGVEALPQPAAASRKQQTGGRKRLAAVADLPAALAQMHALGAGLVQDVLLCSSGL